MTRRPHLRRFTDTIVRFRARIIGFDQYGEWVESGIDRDALPASVQPVGTLDRDEEGGAIFAERNTVFVPVGVKRLSILTPDRRAKLTPLSGTAEVVPVVNRGDPRGFV